MWWILPITSVLRECLQQECWKSDINPGYIVCSCQPGLRRRLSLKNIKLRMKENQTGLETSRRVCHPLLWPVVPTSVCVGLRISFTTKSVWDRQAFLSISSHSSSFVHSYFVFFAGKKDVCAPASSRSPPCLSLYLSKICPDRHCTCLCLLTGLSSSGRTTDFDRRSRWKPNLM